VHERLFHSRLLFKRLGIVLLIYTLCRILFYIFNASLFEDVSLLDFIAGIRFDLVAISVFNFPFIVLSTLPIPWRNHKWYELGLKILFHFINSFCYLLNCIDIEYFKFTAKRSTYDLFTMMGYGEDFVNLIPQFIADFWYIIILWGLLIVLAEFLYRKTQNVRKIGVFNLKYFGVHFIIMACNLSFFVVNGRGGFQLRPITPISAAQSTSPENMHLVLNTPFTMLKTWGKQGLEMKSYFSEKELEAIYSPVQLHERRTNEFEGNNVVILILESFSNEFVGAVDGGKSYTPFLDSLLGESLVFENAIANGKKSMEALPAIASSLPTLMNDPYISSNYSGNQINSLATILKKRGYHTSFFHGATNGSMGFDDFCKAAGFEHYYGRKEFGNDKYYDGNWGIYDEQFMQFMAKKLNKIKEPFFSCAFTISSHHPYKLPAKYKKRFKGGKNPIAKTIQYTDYALERFFDKVSKEDWFDNTIFVITADHTPNSQHPFYRSNRVGIYSIPIAYYKRGSTLKGKSKMLTQQIDIMPTLLDLLRYSKPYVAFGKSVFEKGDRFAANFLGDVYQFYHKGYLLQFGDESSLKMYHYKKDSMLTRNLLNKEKTVRKEMETRLKALIQSYNNRMIKNELILRSD
jgi:phosphoglycerol transferase MdoB-like AlkP superfamily enzyme